MSIFTKIINLFKDIFSFLQKAIPEEVKDATEKILDFTYNIKKVLNSDVAATIETLIPADWPKEFKDKVLMAIDEVLPYLQIAGECNQANTIDEGVGCWIEFLKKQHPELRNAMLMKLAQLLLKKVAGEGMKQSQNDLIAQAVYTGVVKKENFEKKNTEK